MQFQFPVAIHCSNCNNHIFSSINFCQINVQWGGDVNELKADVKGQIEELAKPWSREERDNCINATPATFMGGGSINGYLYGGSPH